MWTFKSNVTKYKLNSHHHLPTYLLQNFVFFIWIE